MRCKKCGDELPKTKHKNPKKDVAVQDLCVRCRLTNLGWKDSPAPKSAPKK